MNPHRIRLRGPWQYQWLDDDEFSPSQGQVTMPQTWEELFGEARGTVRFSRGFNRPTNLQTTTQVDLVFEGISGRANISLNKIPLGDHERDAKSAGPIRCRITDFLQPANLIQVDLCYTLRDAASSGGLWGAVVLEIWEPPDPPEISDISVPKNHLSS